MQSVSKKRNVRIYASTHPRIFCYVLAAIANCLIHLSTNNRHCVALGARTILYEAKRKQFHMLYKAYELGLVNSFSALSNKYFTN